MGRPTVRFVGERSGNLEVLKTLPQNTSGRHIQLLLFCHACKKEVVKSGAHFKKSKSCGCERHIAGVGKTMGAKTMPWQLPTGEAAKRLLIARYKRSAKSKNLEFSLSDEDLETLFKSPCHFCGQSETNVCKGLGKSSGDYAYVGIDRVDTFRGYTKENSVPCCWICNMMKNTLEVGYFLSHIEKINTYQESKK